jgi:hypothetical protein
MESEYKFSMMHEQTSQSDNLVITESLHTNRHASHTLTHLDIKSLTNDNHKLEVTEHNQSALNNNCTLTRATNTVVRGIVDFKQLRLPFTRHEYQQKSSTRASVAVLSSSEDSINNNSDIASTPSTGVMSHSSFALTFEHQQTPSPADSSETLMSPAEAPFGRRYAEISQFKNHPNVEW